MVVRRGVQKQSNVPAPARFREKGVAHDRLHQWSLTGKRP